MSGGEAAPPAQAVDVKVKPGEKTFGYDELKGEGVAPVGCDVTCPVCRHRAALQVAPPAMASFMHGCMHASMPCALAMSMCP